MSKLLKDLASIETGSLVDKVERKFIQLLKDRKLQAGDAIPPEAELTVLLGVSRTVVREATLRLRTMGLIDSRKRRGAVVTNPDIFSILGRSLSPGLLSDKTLQQLFEMRLVLEVGMADLLYYRKTAADIEELRKIVNYEPPVTYNYLFEIDHEVRFHGKLYKMTGNPSLQQFQELLLPIFDFVHQSGMLQNSTLSTQFVSHTDLVDLLETGTPEQFREGMRSHLNSHFVRLFE